MHEKYVFLHCSYSAPVRVLVIARLVSDDALRAIIGVMPRAVLPLRDVLVVALRAVDFFAVLRVVAARDVVVVALRVVARGINVVPRCAVWRFATVDVRT